jgi:hypothetical protein
LGTLVADAGLYKTALEAAAATATAVAAEKDGWQCGDVRLLVFADAIVG